MRKWIVSGVLLAGLFAYTTSAQAHGRHRGGCASDCSQPCETPCAAAAPQFVEKVVTCYRNEWREKEVTSTVNRMVPREEVRKHTYSVSVPVWTEEKRTVTEYQRVAKEVEREVVVCKKVACEAPCGGCDSGCDEGCGKRHHRLFGRRHHKGGGCETPCNYVQEVQKVKCTVYECVPVKRQVVVKVCHTKQETRTAETKCTVWECKPEVVKSKVRYCERVPYQTTVKVPVCESSCGDCGSGGHQRHHRLFHRRGSSGDGCCG